MEVESQVVGGEAYSVVQVQQVELEPDLPLRGLFRASYGLASPLPRGSTSGAPAMGSQRPPMPWDSVEGSQQRSPHNGISNREAEMRKKDEKESPEEWRGGALFG